VVRGKWFKVNNYQSGGKNNIQRCDNVHEKYRKIDKHADVINEADRELHIEY
jgi:hypothetical protein